ncbi:MAG TPA: VOC family virulence protein [Methylococcaceae bacterium]|nr:VOC family virulence protein [Methylococcaceae bacterium]
MIKIKNIDHIVIRARNPETMIHFYCDVLGCRLEKSSEKIGLYQLRAGASLIDIVSVYGELGRQGGRAPSEEGRNMHHFCLRIDPFDEIELKRFLKAKNISHSEVETHYGAEGYGPSLYIEDPENNVIELKGAANSNL